jgi:hypothetical protein
MSLKQTLSTAVAVAAVIFALANLAGAQSGQRGAGWGPIHARSDLARFRGDINDNCAAPVKGTNLISPIVGTWFVSVTRGDTGQFLDLVNFNFGGTLVEQSSTPQIFESGGHGSWVYRGRDTVLTFEEFLFDEDGNPIGRTRVRGSGRVDDQGQLTSTGAIDFIDTDGTVYCNVNSFTATGTRIPALAP